MAFAYVRGFSPFHSGVDLSAPRGTPIHAVAAGSVTWAGNESAPGAPSIARGGGNVVIVAVGGGRNHLYAHLDSIRAQRGQTIAAGALVGGVGATGNATGNHLHFAIWVDGHATDPTRYYSIAALIAAVSGSGPGGAVLTNAGGEDQVRLFLQRLASIGIATTPSHVFTADEARRIATELYQVTGSVADAIARTITGRTVQQLMDQVRSGENVNTSTDPITFLADAIAGIPGHLAHLGQAAGLFLLTLLALYLLVRGGR